MRNILIISPEPWKWQYVGKYMVFFLVQKVYLTKCLSFPLSEIYNISLIGEK